MKDHSEELEFVGRFTDAEWQLLCAHDESGLRDAMKQGKEEAEAFAQAVLGYLPIPQPFSVVLPFAIA